MYMDKNVLVIGGSSQIAIETIKLMLEDGYRVYATSRSEIGLKHDNLFKYRLDVSNKDDFFKLKSAICNIDFEAIIYASGIAISSPVEFLDEEELSRQLDVNLFGLLRTIKHFSPLLIDKYSKIINISSMAAYGVFPFLSPYCLSKAASDILLRAFSNETGIKYVSVRPGAIRTRFWSGCIEDNKKNFKNFGSKYEKIGLYMIENAKRNACEALEPEFAARKIYKAIRSKNPKPVLNIGNDAKFCAFFSKFFRQSFVDTFIKKSVESKSK